jgi:hypothetical protein
MKTLNIGIAADCTYISYHGSVENALIQLLSVVSQARSLDVINYSYIFESQMNVSLKLVDLYFQPVCDSDFATGSWNKRCSVQGYNMEARLSDFSKWRASKTNDSIAIWELFTDCT